MWTEARGREWAEEMETPVERPVEATSAPLLAAAFAIGTHCRAVSDMFMACRQQTTDKFGKRLVDPRACLHLGRKVNACVNEVFDRIGASPCQRAFERYWRCLEWNNHMFMYCRSEEADFWRCSAEHLVHLRNTCSSCRRV